MFPIYFQKVTRLHSGIFKSSQQVALMAESKCVICEAVTASPTLLYCLTCARSDCGELFDQIETTYSSECTKAQLHEAQAASIFAYIRSVSNSEVLLEQTRTHGISTALSNAFANATYRGHINKAIHTACYARLSRHSRIALSVKKGQEFIEVVMSLLSAEEKAQAALYTAKLVKDLSSPLDTVVDPHCTYLMYNRMTGSKLHERHKKDFQDSHSLDYLFRVLSILSLETERHCSKTHSYLRKLVRTVRSRLHKMKSALLTSLCPFAGQLDGQEGPSGDEKSKPSKKTSDVNSPKQSSNSPPTTTVSSTAAGTTTAASTAATASAAGKNTDTNSSSSSAEQRLASGTKRSNPNPHVTIRSKIVRCALQADSQLRQRFKPCADATGVDTFFQEAEVVGPTSSKAFQPGMLFQALAPPAPCQDDDQSLLVVPEAFVSLEFSADNLLQLAGNYPGPFLPQHLSCIIALKEAYGPLFFLLRTRAAIFAQLQTLAVLVPHKSKEAR